MSASPESSTSVDGDIRYSTVVTQVGALVPELGAKGMLIFFGDQAPEELHEISVLHRPEVEVGGLIVGDVLVLDDQQYPILAVGDVANANLVNLGHIDFKFNGESTAPLPGDVCLPVAVPPVLVPGSIFRVIAPTDNAREN